MTSLSDLDTTAVPTPKALKLGRSLEQTPLNSLPRSRTKDGLACEPTSVGSGTHRNCNLNGTCLPSAVFVLSTSESAQIRFPGTCPLHLAEHLLVNSIGWSAVPGAVQLPAPLSLGLGP